MVDNSPAPNGPRPTRSRRNAPGVASRVLTGCRRCEQAERPVGQRSDRVPSRSDCPALDPWLVGEHSTAQLGERERTISDAFDGPERRGRGTDAAKEPRQGGSGHLVACVAEETGQHDPDNTRIPNDRRLTAGFHRSIMPTGRCPWEVSDAVRRWGSAYLGIPRGSATAASAAVSSMTAALDLSGRVGRYLRPLHSSASRGRASARRRGRHRGRGPVRHGWRRGTARSVLCG